MQKGSSTWMNKPYSLSPTQMGAGWAAYSPQPQILHLLMGFMNFHLLSPSMLPNRLGVCIQIASGCCPGSTPHSGCCQVTKEKLLSSASLSFPVRAGVTIVTPVSERNRAKCQTLEVTHTTVAAAVVSTVMIPRSRYRMPRLCGLDSRRTQPCPRVSSPLPSLKDWRVAALFTHPLSSHCHTAPAPSTPTLTYFLGWLVFSECAWAGVT